MPRLLTTLYVYRQAATLIIATVISITLLSLSPEHQLLVSRTVVLTALTPVQKAFSFIPSFFNLRRENRLLREELIQLQLQNAELRESIQENIRLRQLFGFKRRKEFTYLPAEVIAHDAGRVLNGIVIDIGWRDGVRSYMAVVTSEGLAGRVIDAGPISSLVQLLTDRNCRVSSIVQRSRVKGTVAGQPQNELDLRLSLRADIRIGDVVVSSGLGGTFPPGLLIGNVDGVRIEETGIFKQVSISPLVDFNRLEEVFVIVPRAKAAADTVSMSQATGPVLAGRDAAANTSTHH